MTLSSPSNTVYNTEELTKAVLQAQKAAEEAQKTAEEAQKAAKQAKVEPLCHSNIPQFSDLAVLGKVLTKLSDTGSLNLSDNTSSQKDIQTEIYRYLDNWGGIQITIPKSTTVVLDAATVKQAVLDAIETVDITSDTYVKDVITTVSDVMAKQYGFEDKTALESKLSNTDKHIEQNAHLGQLMIDYLSLAIFHIDPQVTIQDLQQAVNNFLTNTITFSISKLNSMDYTTVDANSIINSVKEAINNVFTDANNVGLTTETMIGKIVDAANNACLGLLKDQETNNLPSDTDWISAKHENIEKVTAVCNALKLTLLNTQTPIIQASDWKTAVDIYLDNWSGTTGNIVSSSNYVSPSSNQGSSKPSHHTIAEIKTAINAATGSDRGVLEPGSRSPVYSSELHYNMVTKVLELYGFNRIDYDNGILAVIPGECFWITELLGQSCYGTTEQWKANFFTVLENKTSHTVEEIQSQTDLVKVFRLYGLNMNDYIPYSNIEFEIVKNIFVYNYQNLWKQWVDDENSSNSTTVKPVDIKTAITNAIASIDINKTTYSKDVADAVVNVVATKFGFTDYADMQAKLASTDLYQQESAQVGQSIASSLSLLILSTQPEKTKADVKNAVNKLITNWSGNDIFSFKTSNDTSNDTSSKQSTIVKPVDVKMAVKDAIAALDQTSNTYSKDVMDAAANAIAIKFGFNDYATVLTTLENSTINSQLNTNAVTAQAEIAALNSGLLNVSAETTLTDVQNTIKDYLNAWGGAIASHYETNMNTFTSVTASSLVASLNNEIASVQMSQSLTPTAPYSQTNPSGYSSTNPQHVEYQIKGYITSIIPRIQNTIAKLFAFSSYSDVQAQLVDSFNNINPNAEHCISITTSLITSLSEMSLVLTSSVDLTNISPSTLSPTHKSFIGSIAATLITTDSSGKAIGPLSATTKVYNLGSLLADWSTQINVMIPQRNIVTQKFVLNDLIDAIDGLSKKQDDMFDKSIAQYQQDIIDVIADKIALDFGFTNYNEANEILKLTSITDTTKYSTETNSKTSATLAKYHNAQNVESMINYVTLGILALQPVGSDIVQGVNNFIEKWPAFEIYTYNNTGKIVDNTTVLTAVQDAVNSVNINTADYLTAVADAVSNQIALEYGFTSWADITATLNNTDTYIQQSAQAAQLMGDSLYLAILNVPVQGTDFKTPITNLITNWNVQPYPMTKAVDTFTKLSQSVMLTSVKAAADEVDINSANYLKAVADAVSDALAGIYNFTDEGGHGFRAAVTNTILAGYNSNDYTSIAKYNNAIATETIINSLRLGILNVQAEGTDLQTPLINLIDNWSGFDIKLYTGRSYTTTNDTDLSTAITYAMNSIALTDQDGKDLTRDVYLKKVQDNLGLVIVDKYGFSSIPALDNITNEIDFINAEAALDIIHSIGFGINNIRVIGTDFKSSIQKLINTWSGFKVSYEKTDTSTVISPSEVVSALKQIVTEQVITSKTYQSDTAKAMGDKIAKLYGFTDLADAANKQSTDYTAEVAMQLGNGVQLNVLNIKSYVNSWGDVNFNRLAIALTDYITNLQFSKYQVANISQSSTCDINTTCYIISKQLQTVYNSEATPVPFTFNTGDYIQLVSNSQLSASTKYILTMYDKTNTAKANPVSGNIDIINCDYALFKGNNGKSTLLALQSTLGDSNGLTFTGVSSPTMSQITAYTRYSNIDPQFDNPLFSLSFGFGQVIMNNQSYILPSTCLDGSASTCGVSDNKSSITYAHLKDGTYVKFYDSNNSQFPYLVNIFSKKGDLISNKGNTKIDEINSDYAIVTGQNSSFHMQLSFKTLLHNIDNTSYTFQGVSQQTLTSDYISSIAASGSKTPLIWDLFLKTTFTPMQTGDVEYDPGCKNNSECLINEITIGVLGTQHINLSLSWFGNNYLKFIKNDDGSYSLNLYNNQSNKLANITTSGYIANANMEYMLFIDNASLQGMLFKIQKEFIGTSGNLYSGNDPIIGLTSENDMLRGYGFFMGEVNPSSDELDALVLNAYHA